MYALWVHARDIESKTDADAILARCQATGFTDIFFQVIDSQGKARYNSATFLKLGDLGSFDPLAYLASASGVQVHAWLCVGVDVLYAHPEWNARITRKLSSTWPSWTDFTQASVRQFCADWCAAIAQAYPSVGIHLDYVRWHTDFGGARLPWATPGPITDTVRLIAASLPSATPLTAAVGSNPRGNTSGSWQVWGDWMGALDMAVVMAYPGSTAELRAIMARSAAIDKSKVAIGLSGLYFQYNPYRETRVAPSILADCVNWARYVGYTHFAWFDYTKIDAEQYKVIAQLKPAGGTVAPAGRPRYIPSDRLRLVGRLAALFLAIAAWRYWTDEES